MKVLITGFDPFGDESKNPAYEAVKMLPDTFEDIELVKVEIPTKFYKSIEVLKNHIEKEKPEVVICVGQAGGRFTVSVERVAINVDDARIPDNGGNQPVDQAIVEGGPAAYFSTLPIKAIANAIREGGIPASVSNSAGTYVCNHIMYGLMHMINTQFSEIRGGFIHVPFLEEQVLDKPNMPSMNLDSISKALGIAVKTACAVELDSKQTEGTIC
ncbi:pyroglutamyl-peptidase I [Fusibacter ferrireducens]|uniref:Pyrrolidone-carboxylate peptidase n=1 Tax=Fusibacter ferrireducens TaxID=2785058 RepID=A0ABR9ZZF5_9FIRM|nr:pyroglutamyl-peptidase I [Fusibacter ferrireducens]MBF4695751.1 pyroglutamyl-peptidase I [Fusibacter ferrireducens]